MSQRGQTHWAHAGQHQDLTMCHLPTNSREAIAFPSAFLPWVFYNSWLECKYFRQSQNDKRKGNESNKKLTDHGKLTMTFDLARMQWFALVCNSTIHHRNHSRQWFHQVAIQSLLTLSSCLNSPIVAHMASNYLQNRMVYFPLAFLPFRVPKQPCPFKENSSKGANESSSYFKRRFKRQSSCIFSLQLFSVLQFLFPFLVLSIQFH